MYRSSEKISQFVAEFVFALETMLVSVSVSYVSLCRVTPRARSEWLNSKYDRSFVAIRFALIDSHLRFQSRPGSWRGWVFRSLVARLLVCFFSRLRLANDSETWLGEIRAFDSDWFRGRWIHCAVEMSAARASTLYSRGVYLNIGSQFAARVEKVGEFLSF